MTATSLHLALAALMGLCGVGLLAAGSHLAGGQASIAGEMLLFHATAVIAATTARQAGLLSNVVARTALSVLIVGVVLFAADLALRAFVGSKLFPMAAPLGGGIIMLGWLLLALAAVKPR